MSQQKNIRGEGMLARLAILLLWLSLPALVGCSVERPQGVVLIVVDTLRADHLGVYGYSRDTSSQLERWAEEGMVFERAMSTSPWTLPTFGSILTGRLPTGHGVGYRGAGEVRPKSTRLDQTIPTLAEELQQAGFATAAIINNPWLKPRFGLDRGFDTYDYQAASNKRRRRADKIVDLATSWIDDHRDQPFFLLVHLFDPHMTYDPPPAVRGRFTGPFEDRFSLPVFAPQKIRARASEVGEEERSFITAAYDEEIAFVDQELNRFFEGLVERGLFQQLLVILTADHGEELWDHESFEHGHTVYQELLHVPLVVWGPAVESGREALPVSVIDIPPTVLEAVGVSGESNPLSRSLWSRLTRRDRLEPRPLVAEGVLYGSERKTIIEWPRKLELDVASESIRLFDLESDPGERTDLSPSEMAAARRLEERLRSILEAARSDEAPEEIELDEETLEELRSLGYIE
ncbi:MAG: sulfatase [Thermoanaerobaculia bacterium]